MYPCNKISDARFDTDVVKALIRLDSSSDLATIEKYEIGLNRTGKSIIRGA